MIIVRITGALPTGMAALAEMAASEGVQNVSLLLAGWASGEQRFDRDGAALFAAFDNDRVAGIGGVKWEESLSEPAMRMHRFYVDPAARRHGVGRLIAEAAIAHGFSQAPLLTCNARASAAAAPFWKAMAFIPVNWPTITHVRRLGVAG